MLVRIAADALIAILIRGNRDIVLSFSGFFDRAQLRIHQQTTLIDTRLGTRVLQIGPSSVCSLYCSQKELDVSQRIRRITQLQTQRFGFRLHLLHDSRRAFLRRAVFRGVIRILQIVGVGFFGQHVQEVLADQLRLTPMNSGATPSATKSQRLV